MRRRAPRRKVGWPGTCHVEGDPLMGWTACEVVDISLLGMGIEIRGVAPGDLVGRRIALDVQMPACRSVTIHLAGEVRHTGPGKRGGVRVGMEFTDLPGTVRSVLDALEVMQGTWRRLAQASAAGDGAGDAAPAGAGTGVLRQHAEVPMAAAVGGNGGAAPPTVLDPPPKLADRSLARRLRARSHRADTALTI